jgi:hypothetical protein
LRAETVELIGDLGPAGRRFAALERLGKTP